MQRFEPALRPFEVPYGDLDRRTVFRFLRFCRTCFMPDSSFFLPALFQFSLLTHHPNVPCAVLPRRLAVAERRWVSFFQRLLNQSKELIAAARYA